ncbi:MAG: hypothetical protein LBE76_01980 [Nitrososphaerota archaeon]|nr:hypothetical protein [Nitrososphaerota archaeon]
MLEDVAHIKVVRSVIIVKECDLEKVTSFLEKYNAEVFTRDIVLTPEDEKHLQKKTKSFFQKPEFNCKPF